MVGHVPSPTPIGPTSGDSISVTCSPEPEAAQWSAAMTPAVSQPADPPPAITTCLIRPVVIASAIVTKRAAGWGGASGSTSNGRLELASLLPAELVPRSDHVARSGLRHEHRLGGGTAVDSLDLVREVDRLGLQRQVVAPLVAHVGVELTVLFGVHRVRAGAVEAARQELVAPVVGETHAPAVILVEADHVRRIAQAFERELLVTQAVVVLQARVDQRVVRRHAEAAGAEHVLDVELEAVEIGRALVRRHRDAEVGDGIACLSENGASDRIHARGSGP